MKKVVVVLLLVLLSLGASTASAAVYFYHPSPSQLYELPHQQFYSWGIQWTHIGETIASAVLTYQGIYDWTYEDGDSLYTHLLDNPPLGVVQGTDNQGHGDDFALAGPWMGTWSDPYGDAAHKTNVVYDLGTLSLLDELNAYALDGSFGFGIDPDCHYYNDGICLRISTCIVPEPGTLILLGLGLLGIGVGSQRRK